MNKIKAGIKFRLIFNYFLAESEIIVSISFLSSFSEASALSTALSKTEIKFSLFFAFSASSRIFSLAALIELTTVLNSSLISLRRVLANSVYEAELVPKLELTSLINDLIASFAAWSSAALIIFFINSSSVGSTATACVVSGSTSVFFASVS